MIQRLLKILLIGNVHETFFINFVALNAAFFIRYWEQVRAEDGSLEVNVLISMIILLLMMAFLAYKFVSSKSHRHIEHERSLAVLPQLFILPGVSAMALSYSFDGETNPLVLVLLSILLIRYGVQFIFTMVVLQLERAGLTKNRIYKALNRRMNEALSEYQVARLEALAAVAVGVAAVFALAETSLNMPAQYVTAFALAEFTSGCLYYLRSAGVILK